MFHTWCSGEFGYVKARGSLSKSEIWDSGSPILQIYLLQVAIDTLLLDDTILKSYLMNQVNFHWELPSIHLN